MRNKSYFIYIFTLSNFLSFLHFVLVIFHAIYVYCPIRISYYLNIFSPCFIFWLENTHHNYQNMAKKLFDKKVLSTYCWCYVCRVVKCKFSDSPSCHCSACKSTKIITAYTYKWHTISISETIKYFFFHPWVLYIWEIFEIIMKFYCSENIYYIKVFMESDIQHLTVSVLRRHLEHTRWTYYMYKKMNCYVQRQLLLWSLSFLLTKSEKSILFFPFSIHF